jgi:hypothetical protein
MLQKWTKIVADPEPGSGTIFILDLRDPGWKKIRIGDKRPGS